MKVSDKTIERKTKNTVGARTQLCFTPFPSSDGSECFPLKLTDVLILAWKVDSSLKCSRYLSFWRMFHGAFVKSAIFSLMPFL